MKNSRIVVLFACSVSAIQWVGCSFGNPSLPLVTAVSATKHPLVAQYSIQYVHTGMTAWVEFGTDTNYGRQTADMTSSAIGYLGGTLNILVAGMKPQTTYHMRAHVEGPGGTWVDEDHTFTTAAIPLTAPVIAVASTPGTTPVPGVELLSLIAPGPGMLWDVVTDLQGNIIWYCPGAPFPIRPMQNGHYLLNAATDLLEVDLTCNVVRDVSFTQVNQSLQAGGYSFTVPPPLGLVGGGNPFTHDMLVLPNGHWIGLCEIAKTFTDLPGYPGATTVVGDALVDIDTNGNVVWAWSAFDHLDINRHPYFGLPDWTHSNALVYTPDGNLLLSMRAQSWVLKIDYANGTGSGDILWRLGPDGDFTLLGGDPTQWFYSQHYPNLLSTNGSQMILAVFDNGNYRTDSGGVQCGTSSTAPQCYSRAAIFQVDEGTYVADLMWQNLPGFFSSWGGSIQTLNNGDVEFDASSPNFATASQITELSQSDNPQIVWQMNITGENAYRGYRIPSLYPGVTWQQ